MNAKMTDGESTPEVAATPKPYKLRAGSSHGSYDVLEDGAVIASVHKRERHYNLVRSFTDRWWDLRISGVETSGHDTRTAALAALREWRDQPH